MANNAKRLILLIISLVVVAQVLALSITPC